MDFVCSVAPSASIMVRDGAYRETVLRAGSAGSGRVLPGTIGQLGYNKTVPPIPVMPRRATRPVVCQPSLASFRENSWPLLKKQRALVRGPLQAAHGCTRVYWKVIVAVLSASL